MTLKRIINLFSEAKVPDASDGFQDGGEGEVIGGGAGGEHGSVGGDGFVEGGGLGLGAEEVGP